MEKLFQIFFSRYIIRLIGKQCRYYFYKVIGRSRTIESLSNTAKNNNDYMRALSQDFINALVGTALILIVILSIFIVRLVCR